MEARDSRAGVSAWLQAAGLRAAALDGVGVAHLMRCTVQGDLYCGDLVEVIDHRLLQRLPLQSMHAFGALMPAQVRVCVAQQRQQLGATDRGRPAHLRGSA